METDFPDDVFRTLGQGDPAGTAKYALLTEQLRTMILTGSLGVGARLPDERSFAAKSGLSLGTVQRALRTLVSEGYLVRKPKLGSFVAEKKRIEHPWHCRFLADDGKTILPIDPTTRVRKIVNNLGPWAKHLGPAREGYLYIERYFNVAKEFDVISQFWGDAATLAALRRGPLTSLDGENLKLLIDRKCHLPVSRVTHVLQTGSKRWKNCITLKVHAWSHEMPLYYQEFSIPPKARPMLMSDSKDVAMAAKNMGARK
jgi:DNA-binding GntR family transcriptional regulator